MIITKFSIKHFVAVLVLCLGILIVGTKSYIDMPRESFPDVKVPVVTVAASLDGANPADIETAITIPLETDLDGLEGLEKMRSVSSEGLSLITLEFDPEIETEVALQRIRDAVDKAKGELPKEAEDPIVKEFSFSGDVPVLVLNLVGPLDLPLSELKDLAEKIEDELKRVPSVLDVKIRGGREREILVEIDPERLAFHNLSIARIQGILNGTNKNVSAGVAEGKTNRIVMRTPGEFKSPADIFSVVVALGAQGSPIYLKDVANVRYSFEDERSRARFYDFTQKDGEKPGNAYVEPLRSISIEVMKKNGENIIEMNEAVMAVLASLSLPENIRAITSFDASKDVKMMVSDLENGILTSLILVVLVIVLGLGPRNALLVGSAIPFSMLISIIVLDLLGITLNMMVLYSLILALGMLVDNAIVIVENIYRHLSMGVPRAQAAFVGTSEVAWPVITSTATTLGAFMPLVFWPGMMGEFMGFLPKTVIVVLSSSLFVALVINPTLAALFMKANTNDATGIDPESQRPTRGMVVFYGRMLEFILDRPYWTLTTSLGFLFLVVGIFAVFGAGTEFFPALDPKLVVASIKPPEGISLEASDRLGKAMEDRIFGKAESGYSAPVSNLKHATVTVSFGEGSGAFGEQVLGPINTRISFVDRDYWTEPTSLTLAEIRNRINGLDKQGNPLVHPLFGADFNVTKQEEGPPAGKPVSIDIFGQDLNVMAKVVGDMKKLMAETDGVAKPSDDASTSQPTLEWTVDLARAGMLGLDQSTVATALQIAVGGLKNGVFGHGDDEQDVVFRLPEIYRSGTSRLENVLVPSSLGAPTPIASVASAVLTPGPVSIKHFDRKRVLNAGAEVHPWIRADADVRANFQEKVKRYSFPPGITHEFGGAAEEEQKSTEFLQEAFLVALFAIAVILVLQFNSVLVPAIVMCSVVLSFIGVFLGLLVFNMPFGIIMSGIGVISLAGVVVNNAIVLLDAIEQFQRMGQPVREAVVTACMIRFRPVMLTAITTILGLLPMAIKLNIDFIHLTYQYNTESSQWWQSMAVAVIFGLLAATVLTLGVVPSLYLIYDRFHGFMFRKFGRVEVEQEWENAS